MMVLWKELVGFEFSAAFSILGLNLISRAQIGIFWEECLSGSYYILTEMIVISFGNLKKKKLLYDLYLN